MKIVNKIYNEIKYLIKLKTVKDTILLFWSFLLVTLLWIITSSLITKSLWPDNYWKFSLIISIVGFLWLFFEFWYFSSSTRLLWIEKNKKKEKNILWTLIIITFIISILFLFFLILSSFVFDFFIYPKEKIWKIILYTSPLLMFFPFSYMLPQALQWMNEMKINALYNIIRPFIYLIFIIFLISFINLNLFNTIIAMQLSLIISLLIILLKIKPIFNWFKKNYKLIKEENKVFWKYIYLWRIFEQSTFKLDTILIAFFLSSKEVWFYVLAFMIVSPISTLSRELSRSLYKNFSHANKIPKKVILYNFIWLVFSSLWLIIIWKYLILFLFWVEYIEVWNILWLVIIAVFFQGIYQPINNFINTKKELWIKIRKILITLWILNILFNIILIKYLWLKWALYSTILIYLISFILQYKTYNEFKKWNS